MISALNRRWAGATLGLTGKGAPGGIVVLWLRPPFRFRPRDIVFIPTTTPGTRITRLSLGDRLLFDSEEGVPFEEFAGRALLVGTELAVGLDLLLAGRMPESGGTLEVMVPGRRPFVPGDDVDVDGLIADARIAFLDELDGLTDAERKRAMDDLLDHVCARCGQELPKWGVGCETCGFARPVGGPLGRGNA